ncbi:MAG: hypothetical protein A3G34_01660 [Candidatus Lindowbacteria bacterium RIFCSPLOWO2_12_FULL_62_27]|nr:MAG: hypothetical protein A3G34_01660 [Candidatus Lindowbacteria bacterium RIFCSPLOWO2_12_FULL_62_27]
MPPGRGQPDLNPRLSAREGWALLGLVLAGIFFRVWILEGAGISPGGQNYYYREIVRGMRERGEIGLYPYRADAFVEFPEIINDPTPPIRKVDRTLQDFGVSVESDSRFMEWTPLLRYPPGFPVFLYAAHGVLGDKTKRVVLLCIVLNGIMIALTFPVAWMLFQRRDVAWAATAVNAFWIFTAKNSATYDPASLVIPVMMAACHSALMAWHTGRWRWVLSMAALSFVASNLRADTFFVSLLLPLALWFRPVSIREKLIKPAAAIAVALALWIPWSYHNLNHFGVFRPFPAGAGFNILVTIGRYAPESGFPADDYQTIVWDLGEDAVRQKLWPSDVTYPNGVARDKRKLDRAVEWIREHPVRYAAVMLVHMRYFFFAEEEAVEQQIRGWFSAFPPAVARVMGWIGRAMEPAAILLACACLWRKRKDSSMMVPVMLLWSYVLPHLPLWVESRYFKAAWPIVLIFSVACILTMIRRPDRAAEARAS